MKDGAEAAWRPRAGPGIARLRARLLAEARRFLDEGHILEVTVPTLSPAAASDPGIESLEVAGSVAASPRYLHTSPEYAMKRLLAAGFPDIGYVGTVYRDAEIGSRHQPEFTMIEWYREGYDLCRIMAETEALIARLLRPVLDEVHAHRRSYASTFASITGIDVFAATTHELATAAAADPALRDSLADDRDAWLDLLLATRIAPSLPARRMTTLYHYPASQAALARLCPEDSRIADRFEVFVGDLEVANGYVELTDATEQRRRFEADTEQRRRQSRPVRPTDEHLIAALEAGLPACAGVAVGFDRLLMLRAGCADIRDVLHFPLE